MISFPSKTLIEYGSGFPSAGAVDGSSFPHAPPDASMSDPVEPPIVPPIIGGNVVQFTNPIGITGTWYLGDGNSSTDIDPVYEYAVHGTYNVLFDADTGSFDDIALEVIVAALPLPTASFTAVARDPESNVYDFVGSGAGAGGSYAFLIDGSLYATQSVTHTFATNGDYSAELVVTDASSNTDYAYQNITGVLLPNQMPVGVFTYSAFKLDVAFTSGFTDPDGGNLTYLWEFDVLGGGATSTDESPNYSYLTDGTYTTRVTVTDDRGGALVHSEDLTVSSALSLGPELMANPDFSTGDLSDFTFTGSTPMSISGGELVIAGYGTNRMEINADGLNSMGLDTTKSYMMTLTSKLGTATDPRIYSWDFTSDGAGGDIDEYLRDTDWTTREIQFDIDVGREGDYILRCYPDRHASVIETFLISQMSIKEIL